MSERTSLPVIAIGGIDASNAAECIHSGAAGVAVIRAVAEIVARCPENVPGCAEVTGRVVYVEYSNEVWNYQFDQAQFNLAQAKAEERRAMAVASNGTRARP